MSKLYIKINILYLLAISVLFTGTAFAKISVQPSRIEATVPPGKSFEDSFVVENIGDKPASVTLDWRDRTKDPLIEDWFKIDKESLDLQPGEEGQVRCSISIPEGATGEYNAWFVITEGDTQKPIRGGANIALRTSIPVYVTIKGTERYDFEVNDLSVTNINFFRLTTNILNSGNVHIRPTGSVYIKNLETGVEYNKPFNHILWGIIANQRYDYITWLGEDENNKIVLEDGTYSAFIRITAGDEDNRKEWNTEIEFKIDGAKGEITKGFKDSTE